MNFNGRKFDRIKHRLTCEVIHDDRRSSGIVLDSSARGIFVRMSTVTAPPMGSEVRVVLSDAGLGEMSVIARVVRANAARREVVVAGGGGIAFEILSAPEDFYTTLLKPLIKS